MPGVEKFVKFWGGNSEGDSRTHNMSWMEKIREEWKWKSFSVKEFDITENVLNLEIKKKKN